MSKAACAGERDVEFVPDDPAPQMEPPERVERLCSGCPVADACLAFGVATESTGWWGGQFLWEGRRTVRIRWGEVAVLAPPPRSRGAKLSDEDVDAIRRRWADGGVTQADLAADYGVGVRHVRDVVAGRLRNGAVIDNAGERHGRRKLAQAEVEAIRGRYGAGGVTMRELATEFGVATSSVSQIVNFRRWNR